MNALEPSLAVFADTGASSIVNLNGMRLMMRVKEKAANKKKRNRFEQAAYGQA